MPTSMNDSPRGPRAAGLALGLLGAGAATLVALRAAQKAGGKSKTIAGDNEPDVVRTVTIRAPAADLYRFWHDFAKLPEIMENIEAIRPLGDGSHEWVVKAPLGQTLSLKTRVTQDTPNEVIAWSSTPESAVATSGEVRFSPAPGDRGTRVTLSINYDPPGGEVGRLFAKLMRREPAIQARHDLKRLKMLFETGEIATSARRIEDVRAVKQAKEQN